MKLRSAQRAASSIAIIAVSGAVLFTSVGMGSNELEIIEYAGEAPKDPPAVVAFDLRKKGGENFRADFGIDEMTMSCSDGSVRRTNVGLDVRFRRRHTFHAVDEDVNPQSSDRYVLEIKGKLLEQGRARGFISYLVDREDPPVAGFSDQPDCATDGKVRWRATRIG